MNGAKYPAKSFKVVSDTEVLAVSPSVRENGNYRTYVIGADGKPSTADVDANEFNVGSPVRDESINFNSQNFGDSINNGFGNVVDTVAALEGVSNQALGSK